MKRTIQFRVIVAAEAIMVYLMMDYIRLIIH